MTGRVLIIAGSDPSGGAGIQADIKTVTALGGYAATAITALTVQNTLGVTAVQSIEPSFIRDQMNAVLDDIGADAIKIGMIGNADAAETIAETITPVADTIPVVLDPVLVATSGDSLAGKGVIDVIRARLISLATIITPNSEEAAALTGNPVATPADLTSAGEELRSRFSARAALVKGGHLTGDTITDVLVTEDGATPINGVRVETTSTHGTGCTLASAIATQLAFGVDLTDACIAAVGYVREAIDGAQGLGSGHGPLHHACRIQPPLKRR